jgi:hypothetical protein
MRTSRFGIAVAASLFLLPPNVLPSSAQSIQFGPGGVRVDDGRRGGGQCEQLRRACENKDALGEQGEGNCRRYRESCGGRAAQPSRQQVCAQLRNACMNKEELGEQGEGNCRRYRATCRGR